MDTVQIECGNCGKVMAVKVAHLGAQVHCPHCRAIVQAPPPPSKSVPNIRVPNVDVEATESIFAEPGETDALFGEPPGRPLVEMPSEMSAKEAAPERTVAFGPPEQAAAPALGDRTLDEEEFARAGVNQPGPAPSWLSAPPAGAAAAEPEETPSEMPVVPRRPEKQSNLAAVLLIFLVPYAILATIVIIILLKMQGNYFDPLERLPDPKPKDGGPRLKVSQVAHDTRLPAKLKTKLAQPVQVGDIEITPLKVWATDEDQLVLEFKARNLSKNLIFNPVSDAFLRYVEKSMDAGKPYTYLDCGHKKLFGGFGEWLAGPAGQEQQFDGDIGPGEEEIIRITTEPRYRKDVQQLRKSKDDLTWRVQVRRGLVQVRDKDVSATAVIGVEFNASMIQ